ncbi:MAG TPA: class I SAM-dependent methyltransferase [Polyangiales bacterium]|nr:class I SAM-dependent methyltransferase [Polyangiales bacterium]
MLRAQQLSRSAVRVRPRLLETIHERSRRRKLTQLLEEFRPGPDTRLLEVGVDNVEPLASTNYLIKNYPHRSALTALGIGDMSGFARMNPGIPVYSYDGQHFPFPDRSFDIVHSNAVIEHVGSREAQRQFLAELRRVGRCGMVTTPNKYFPIETHTLLPLLHWTDEHTFRRRIDRIGTENLGRMFRTIGFTFPTADLPYLRLLSASELRVLAAEVGMAQFSVRTRAMFGWPFAVTLTWYDN